MINNSLLHAMFPKAPLGRLQAFAAPMQLMEVLAALNTKKRLAMCLAQIAHETGELRWLEEIWGPTAAQKGYEGRKDLGNAHPGDGYRYRGRGLCQLTGRRNYAVIGMCLGLPLEAEPDLAKEPEPACRIAADYWLRHRLNKLADEGDVEGVTRVINGGLNGLEDRRRYYNLYMVLLSVA